VSPAADFTSFRFDLIVLRASCTPDVPFEITLMLARFWIDVFRLSRAVHSWGLAVPAGLDELEDEVVVEMVEPTVVVLATVVVVTTEDDDELSLPQAARITTRPRPAANVRRIMDPDDRHIVVSDMPLAPAYQTSDGSSNTPGLRRPAGSTCHARCAPSTCTGRWRPSVFVDAVESATNSVLVVGLVVGQ
jgi:hypothetical protein